MHLTDSQPSWKQNNCIFHIQFWLSHLVHFIKLSRFKPGQVHVPGYLEDGVRNFPELNMVSANMKNSHESCNVIQRSVRWKDVRILSPAKNELKRTQHN